jgi:hypothetical protein
MITAEKLRIYSRYNGDVDGWARVRAPDELGVMTDQDWADIDLLLQRFSIEKSGFAAASFFAETSRLIAEQVPDIAAVARLRELAK